MAEWYFVVWIDHIVFIHSSINGHLGCFYLWAIVNNTTTNICIQFLFEHLFPILLGIDLGVELLGHMIILYLIYCGNTELFTTGTAPF